MVGEDKEEKYKTPPPNGYLGNQDFIYRLQLLALPWEPWLSYKNAADKAIKSMSCNMQFSKKHTGSLDNLQKFGFSFFDDDVYVLTVSLLHFIKL